MKPNAIVTTLALVGFGMLGACADEDDVGLRKGVGPGDLPDGGSVSPPDGSPDGSVDPDDPALCSGREYVGFGSTPLAAGRVVAKLGVDRLRMKPFSALQTEIPRVLGSTPASLAGSAATFGDAPARWFDEPQANAVALQTAFAVAFDGCLTYTASAPEFAGAPDATTATTQCTAMARKFWSKTPTAAEVQACADVAVSGAAAEPQARRKWAYACASVLTASGFLTY